MGVAISWWDWWRRQALQEVLYAEEKALYWKKVNAMNSSMRYGEEDEIGTLTEYLAGYTQKA